MGCGASQPTPIADLVIDSNRNGVVEPGVDDEDVDEDTWDDKHGAIFLANLDDDDSDGQPDATDSVVNGPDDIADLTPFEVRAWPDAPSGARATVSVDPMSASRVRIFRIAGSPDDPAAYQAVDNAEVVLDAAALKTGVKLAIEGLELVTSTKTDAWNGLVQLSLHVDAGAESTTSAVDSAKLRLAPVVFQHHLMPTERVYYTEGGQDSAGLAEGLAEATSPIGIKVESLDLGDQYDQWTQDFFDVGHMSRPAPGGKLIDMRIFIRSPQNDRGAGAWIENNMLGPDQATLYIHGDEERGDLSWSMSSFGNFDVVPPYDYNGASYPLGRALYGAGENVSQQPDAAYTEFVRAQQVQPPITIDTSFLLVGHVDEITSFIKTNTPRGWALLVAEPATARTMLQTIKDGGHATGMLFQGRKWIDWSPVDTKETPAEISVADVLADADLMAASQAAQIYIGRARDKLQKELGLTDEEIIPMPFLIERVSGALVAYQPGTVNLLYANGQVVIPEPFGPIVDGHDPFKQDIEQRLSARGIDVFFADVWNTYHRNSGEVHCGTNAMRRLEQPWWGAGR
jgi:protein-arginine deiminase